MNRRILEGIKFGSIFQEIIGAPERLYTFGLLSKGVYVERFDSIHVHFAQHSY